MSDGERLVWALTYSLVFDRDSDPVEAARAAAYAVDQLRKTAQRALPGSEHILQLDERDLLDEIVNIP
jgi:hypothetical protein